MGFKEAVRSVLSQYATFSGRARRSEYWYFVLFNILTAIAASIIGCIIGYIIGGTTTSITIGTAFYYLACLALLIPGLAVSVRRLHDTDHSGWWLLAGLVPVIGGLAILVLTLMDSKPDNQYGRNPKGF